MSGGHFVWQSGTICAILVEDILRNICEIILNLDQCSPVENQNELELDFKVFFLVDSCYLGIVLDESN